MGEGERPEGVRHSDRSRGQRGDCERERAKASRAYLDSYVVGLGGLHRPSNIGERGDGQTDTEIAASPTSVLR